MFAKPRAPLIERLSIQRGRRRKRHQDQQQQQHLRKDRGLQIGTAEAAAWQNPRGKVQDLGSSIELNFGLTLRSIHAGLKGNPCSIPMGPGDELVPFRFLEGGGSILVMSKVVPEEEICRFFSEFDEASRRRRRGGCISQSRTSFPLGAKGLGINKYRKQRHLRDDVGGQDAA